MSADRTAWPELRYHSGLLTGQAFTAGPRSDYGTPMQLRQISGLLFPWGGHGGPLSPVYAKPVSRPRSCRQAPAALCLNGGREQGFGPRSGCANLVRAIFTVVLQRLPDCLLSATRLSPSPTGSTRRLRRQTKAAAST